MNYSPFIKNKEFFLFFLFFRKAFNSQNLFLLAEHPSLSILNCKIYTVRLIVNFLCILWNCPPPQIYYQPMVPLCLFLLS